MVDKKNTRKSKSNINTSSPAIETTNTGFWDYFRFGESYTSLILGIVVVIIAAVLLVSFVKNRSLEQLTKPNPEISSIATSRQAENIFPREYTVQAGDDLWKIAEKTYNDGYQWVAIAKANNITNPSQITAGQKLQLPKIDSTKSIAMSESTPTPTQKIQPTVTPVPTQKVTKTVPTGHMNAPSMQTTVSMSPISGSSYTVVHGDNLWNIAVRAYGDGFQWTKIANANHLANPRIIHSGNVLTIPR